VTDPDAWGIAPGYHDHQGDWRPTPEATATALLEVMGADGRARPSTGEDAVRVVVAGEGATLDGRWTLETEDGGDQALDGELPPDLPLGYHELRRDDGRHVRLVVTPPACFFPDGLRTWGWAVQLYAARSGESWGMGDLGDLRRLARWAAGQGAGLALINPLHAVLPTGAQQASPYSPSSRCYRNPLYLRVEEVPGASDAEVDLDSLAAAGRELNSERLIDREAVWRLKLDALQRIWDRFDADPGFDRYCQEQGPALEAYATFCVLAEHHGVPWPEWPDAFQHPESDDVEGFADARRDQVRPLHN
jgi:4-alpha-glucanotransferase